MIENRPQLSFQTTEKLLVLLQALMEFHRDEQFITDIIVILKQRLKP